MRARAQGEGYARALPATEGRPPFVVVVVVDVGHVIELYAEFTRSGGTYTPFPDPRSHRIRLEDLRQPAILERLRTLWTDPMALDPARANARVTRAVAAELAKVARSLEADGHTSHDVAAFLTRCLFSMFAEDVGLLPVTPSGDGAFSDLLKRHREDPPTLQRMMAALWGDMDQGGFSPLLAKDVLRFNGKLFKNPKADAYALLLKPAQIDGLIEAARSSWKEVEPSIFGTLLERALDPTERHALGAHYTPRAYVERLVLPTVVEPLRVEWADAQAAALLLANEANALEGRPRELKLREARDELRRFHHRLSTVKVLDPACGSGNFLYVTLEHLKRLEGEVLNQLEALGDTQASLVLEGETVIFAVDAFLPNEDRHSRNFMWRTTVTGLTPLAFDFSRAWLLSGLPFGSFPLGATTNTLNMWKHLKGHFGYAPPADAFRKIASLPDDWIEQVLTAAPPQWIASFDPGPTIEFWVHHRQKRCADAMSLL